MGLAALALLTGCAASTPGCDEAAGLLDAARVDDAAVAYAAADLAGEGDCAAAGLAAAAAAHRDAAVSVARGQDAERRQDRAAALTEYRAATGIDAGVPAAADGLRRLGAEPPQFRPVSPPPPATTATLVLPWWPFAAAGVLLAAAVGAGFWWARTVVRTGEHSVAVRDALDRTAAELAGVRADLGLDDHGNGSTGGTGGTAADRFAALDQRLRGVADELDRLARDEVVGRDRLERQLDDVADQLDGLERTGPGARRHFTHDGTGR